MPIDRTTVRHYLQAFDFKNLFIEEMGWSKSNPRAIPMEANGTRYQRRAIAQQSGVSVFEVFPAEATAQLPDAKTRKLLHEQIEKLSHENLIIFLDNDQKRTQSLWYWVKRDGKKSHPREHLYMQGQPGDLFLSKLDSMVIELDDLREDGTLPISDVTKRLASALDIERVTKKFYTEFSTLRVAFIDKIDGIQKDADRFWYASVLLNRLMFIYFLQKRGFIQNNTRYLDEHLQRSKQRGADRYYSEFLQLLFFEGFAKPSDQRSAHARQLLGEIKYLNGGLFLPHKLERDYPTIRIPDVAFEDVLKLFGNYSWHLDDTPGATDNEINPDVLGYIFEKYINQKAFGAYYTRSEITQYLCERTLHATVLERVHQHTRRTFNDLNEVLVKLDAELCRVLLFDILPKLSILDPSCGSGAFLVAAMKTLLNLYAAVYGKIDFLNDTNLTAHLKDIRQNHPSINYYVRKCIITNNLYGVDIMEEATEIARLRLFLFLVSSADKVTDLEPLPNIDFNIMQGNSLIGLLHVDEQRFNKANQVNLFTKEKADQYASLLETKNRLIRDYKHTADNLHDTVDLSALRQQIVQAKANAYAVLHDILLQDFQELGIKYEQAQPNGKPTKRPVKLDDITTLTPFHWGYEFDEIMKRGGFDIIIANPPWETFKPQAKEFFADYSDHITKNKMTIKDFEKELETLLKDPAIAQEWARYQSRFPYVSAYYRSAPTFINQISIVNGKKAGTDINLYKLFTEQAYNLLRDGGECGIVIPSGIYTDLGAKQLREMLFAQTTLTGLFAFENRKEIFEGVHRSFKFVVMTYRKGGITEAFPAAFMRHAVSELEGFPHADSLLMHVATVRKLAPDSLSIPEFKSETDAHIAEKMGAFPLLGETLTDKWNVKFSSEFHMTNDSHLFKQSPAPGRLPLYEGKMIHQFTHQWGKPKYWLDEAQARTALLGRTKDTGQTLDYQGYRLGFRDIARNTDQRTMIMTVIPKRVYCNHKIPTGLIFNNKKPDYPSELLLSSIMNSFIIDFLARQRVTTNLTFFILYQLPIPRLMAGDRFFSELVERAGRLICTTPEYDDLAHEIGLGDHTAGITDEAQRAHLRAEIDAMVAHLYGLTETEFAYILSTFPIVDERIKQATLHAFRMIVP